VSESKISRTTRQLATWLEQKREMTGTELKQL